MIPVIEVEPNVFKPAAGVQVLDSRDGKTRAPLQVILHESWTAEDRAAYGVYLAEPFQVPPGKIAVGPPRYAMFQGKVREVYDIADAPKRTLFDGAEFLARVTDAEYTAIADSPNPQVRRWLEIFRLRGEIDVAGETAKAAKAGLVKLGLLTQERADAIFKPE